MRRCLAVVTALLMLFVTVAGCTDHTGDSGRPDVTTSTIAMPDVVGVNAAVAVDTLKKLGFTNIDLGTVDGRPAVVLPQNWTVKEQSAKPGELLAADAKIVLGCTRNGDGHWPLT
jgi:PASTA domain-containing protein